MPDWGGVAGGALGGAETGASIGSIIPGIGTAIGAGIGAVVGAIPGLFGESEEEIRAKRKNELLKQIAAIRAQAIRTGITQLADVTTRQAANVRQAAAQRAASLGRTGQAESFIAPGEQATMAGGSAAAREYMTDVNKRFAPYEVGAEEQYANRPIQPNISDYLQRIGATAMRYKQNEDWLKAISGFALTDVSQHETPLPLPPYPDYATAGTGWLRELSRAAIPTMEDSGINRMAEIYKQSPLNLRWKQEYPRIPAYSEFE